jgi:RNA polymerase sigma-70 factor (ECF subfamily)
LKESQEALFTEYLEGYKKLIIKVARIYCIDPEDRKDLIQDIIVQLWKSYPKYDRTFSVSTWTYRIAINVSISHLRKVATRTKTQNSYHQENDLLQITDTHIDENLEQLYRFIDLLKPIDKAIIILYLEGCKNKEISSVMGMSVTNISTKKQRIKEELKTYFESLKQKKDEI